MSRNAILIAILCVTAMAFIIIGHIWRETIQTPLKTVLLRAGPIAVDWWSVSHVAFYFIIGLLNPGHFYRWLFVGAGFEAFEDFLSADETTQLVNCKINKDTMAGKIWCNGLQDDYWYGKWDDIIMNSIGYVMGEYIMNGRISVI